jgi:DNA-binding NarL/FixJ family response regulator
MPEDSFAAAQAALKLGDWQTARSQFERALAATDSPEAHDGLGIALWWLNDISASHQQRITAYHGFRQRGDFHLAAAIAAWLAREQVFFHSNLSAMKGWFALADRLIVQAGECSQAGWVALYRASMLATPAALETTAAQVVTLSRNFNDASLEMLALAFLGLACVSQNRFDEGLALVDEAMASATSGEVENLMAISEIFCVTLSACEIAGETTRAEHWYHAADEFARQYRCSFLSAYCRTAYGSLLVETGRWQDAETALTTAIEQFEQGHRGLRVNALFKLADLQISQGRLEEAAVLLAGYEDHSAALLPLARLHFARGDSPLARAILDQALAAQGRSVALLTLLVQLLLATGAIEEAQVAADELTTLAVSTRSNLLLAHADLSRGQVKRHLGDYTAPLDFQSALVHLRDYAQSRLASRARMEMAYTLKDTDPVGAGAWANAALASFNRLGAKHEAAEATRLLRELGIAPHRSTQTRDLLTRREQEVLALLAAGLSNKAIAERLVISVKTVEHHVSQILGKTGLHSRAEAAAFALAQKDKGLR